MSEHAQDWRRLIGRCVTIRKPGDVLDGRAGVILYPVLPCETEGDRLLCVVLIGGVVRRTYDLTDLSLGTPGGR